MLAETAVGEARAVAADMAPGAHPQLEVAPRLVGAAPLCLRAEAGYFEGLAARAWSI